MKECHGHIDNKVCKKCHKYNQKSFQWDITCTENKQMLNYKLTQQLENKKEKTKVEKTLLKQIKNENKKIGTSSFLRKGDFFYDFNYGIRFFSKNKSFLVKIFNLDSGNNILTVKTIPGEIYSPLQKFYVRWGIQVYEQNKLYFKYEFNLQNKNVLIHSKSICLGDNIAFIESASSFQKKHNCKVDYLIKHPISNVLANNYPNINFINKKTNKKYFATYQIFCGSNVSQYQTIVYDRIISLDKIPAYILNVEYKKIQKLKCTESIDFGGKYITYSEKASSKMKEWNNPKQLKKVIEYIQSLGFKVVNIDIKPYIKNIPDVIYLNDKNYSLQDKVNIISGSTFFLGLPSGLSWLAWACYVPTIVFGGFCLPICEYENPYRIISTDFCFGCWNYRDQIYCSFDNDKNKFAICNKSITAKQIISTIDKLLNDLKNE